MDLNSLSYFKVVVSPSIEDFRKDPGSIRFGIQAAVLLNHQVDYIAHENWERDLHEVMKRRVDAAFLEIKKECPEIEAIRSIANLAKHCQLSIPKKPRVVVSASEINTPPGLFSAPFGEGVFSEAASVQIAFEDDEKRELLPIVNTVFKYFQKKYEPS